jgi:hypothetical protein
MKKLLTVFTFLFVVVTLLISGCSEREPILPDDVAEKIQDNLGYALAPAWLPEGYDYAGPFPNMITIDRAFTGNPMMQSYGKDDATIEDILFMSYPLESPIPLGLQEIVDLTSPEDAITETEINGNTAYLYQGGWSEETIRRIAKLEEPIDPEWDYEGKISIRFTIDIPDKGNIWISIGTIFSVEDITQKDLIKIAESVTVIE